MHSYLVSSLSNLEAFDPKLVTNSPDTLHVYPDKSVGIAEIRSIQTFLSKKPIQSSVNSVIVHNAELLTTPAQNAFLKTLEEPPANSQIFLISENPDNLLATVLSRVQKIENKKQIGDFRDFSQSLQLFKQVLQSSLSEKVSLLESQNFTKIKALTFLEDLEYAAKDDQQIYHYLPQIWSTKKLLNANVNVRLSLGELFFALSQSENLS